MMQSEPCAISSLVVSSRRKEKPNFSVIVFAECVAVIVLRLFLEVQFYDMWSL